MAIKMECVCVSDVPSAPHPTMPNHSTNVCFGTEINNAHLSRNNTPSARSSETQLGCQLTSPGRSTAARGTMTGTVENCSSGLQRAQST